MKLLLSSFGPSPTHDAALAELIGRPTADMRVAYIENAHDVYDDQRERDGYTVQRLTDAQALVIDGEERHLV